MNPSNDLQSFSLFSPKPMPEYQVFNGADHRYSHDDCKPWRLSPFNGSPKPTSQAVQKKRILPRNGFLEVNLPPEKRGVRGFLLRRSGVGSSANASHSPLFFRAQAPCFSFLALLYKRVVSLL